MADNDNFDFKAGTHVVYPAHGVGIVEGIETHNIGGTDVSLYAIVFEKDRMRLKIPVMKAEAAGLRKLSTSGRMDDAMKTLKGKARVRRTMWSRRAQEYEMKINSGDPVAIAEVLRDLKRSNDDTDARSRIAQCRHCFVTLSAAMTTLSNPTPSVRFTSQRLSVWPAKLPLLSALQSLRLLNSLKVF